MFAPPRPDERWVAGKGRQLHEPTHVPRRLPSPPKVCVMVRGDLAHTVREYVEGLDRWVRYTEEVEYESPNG